MEKAVYVDSETGSDVCLSNKKGGGVYGDSV